MAKRKKMDETEYIMSSPAMVARVEQARLDILEGKGVQIDLKNLWETMLHILNPRTIKTWQIKTRWNKSRA